MVGHRNIKRLVQFSAVGFLILTFLIFAQWEDISYVSSLKRRSFGLVNEDDIAKDEDLIKLEEKLDVNRLLKKIERDVALRIQKREGLFNDNTRHHNRRLVNNDNDTEDSVRSTEHPISHSAGTQQVDNPTTDQSRDKKLKASRKKKYRRHRRKFSWQTHKWRGYMMGQLNVHVWQAWCGNTIHDLRRNWFFPLYPDLRLTVRRFYVKHYEYDYGQRVFGYLHPPLTGKYIFALSSDDTSELWLSTDENPENVQLLSWVGNLTGFQGNYRTYYAQFTKYNSQISKEIYLEKDKKYFVETLHKQGAKRDHILVGWKIPGLPGFRYITGNSISMYIYDPETSPDVTHYAGYIPQTIASHIRPRNWSMVLNKNVHKFGTKSRSDMKYRSEKAPHFDLDYMLYECKYEPSYLVKNFSLNRYEGVKLIHDSAVYPNDHTAFTHMKRFDKCLHRRAIDSHGNSLHLKQPKLSNHSLYDEGSITVFADDDKGSIVMLYSDLAETYTMADGDNEEILNSDKLVARSLNESVKLVTDIYENTDVSQSLVEDETIQTNDPRKIGNTAQFSFKESYRDNTKLLDPRNSNHGNTRQFDARNSHQSNRRKHNSVHRDVGKSDQLGDRNRHQWNTNHFNSRNGNGDSRHGNTIQFVPKNNHHDNVNQAGYQNNPILDSERVRNSERVTRTAPMHVRPKRVQRDQQSNNKQVNNVENLRNHLDQISLSDNDNSEYNTHQQYGELRRNREISRKRDSYDQTVNPDLKHVEPVLKQINRDSKQVNPDLNRDHGHVTLRKLMSVNDAPRDNRDNQANQPNQVSQSRQINRANGIKQAMPSSQAHLVNQTNQDTTQQDDSDVDDNGTEDDDDNETDDNDDDDDSDVEGGRNQPTRPVQSSSVPGQVIYFNPARAPQNQSYQQFQLSETILSRIDAARDYVRRMIKVVQIYKYQITKKQLADQILRRFGIRMEVPELEIYYEYDPWLYHHNTTKCTTDGNILLSENVAHSVVLRFMRSLDDYIPHRFKLDRIINVEENHDIVNGDRYLVELELFDIKLNRTVSSSQYIYQPIGYSHFCSPQHFSINHKATVHVIIPVKNQGRWVQYFIEDMSELCVTTGDTNLNVIIVDFSSDDIDIQDALERSPLKRYRVITLTGPFQRAFGIQAGAAVITNPNDIIFMCDLHLEIPNNMIDIIRKHCIQGRMAFAPIVTRLHCGFTPSIPYGFWELQGYGLFAMYKSDFSRVGGMNYREFGTRWGGEDWELLDRVLLHRMEVERLRVPNFYHFYHSKKGMWGSPTVDTVTSDIGAQYYRDKNQIIPLYKPTRVRVISADDPLVQTIHDADTVTERTRHLRSKRPAPSRVIRSASRVRRGYRQPAKPKGYDKNGGRLYRKR